MNSPTVVLGVSGSIAAYKACEIVSLLRKAGCEVHVAMTPEAVRLVTPLTFQTVSRHAVLVDLFEEAPGGWQPGHIELADRADLLVAAPATAHLIAEFAHGLASNAVSTLALATAAPMLVAPAMNGKMWNHPATRSNVAILRERGAHFVDPDVGELACGYEGVGKLATPERIVEAALALLKAGN